MRQSTSNITNLVEVTRCDDSRILVFGKYFLYRASVDLSFQPPAQRLPWCSILYHHCYVAWPPTA
jgi:hypothetical protein